LISNVFKGAQCLIVIVSDSWPGVQISYPQQKDCTLFMFWFQVWPPHCLQ